MKTKHPTQAGRAYRLIYSKGKFSGKEFVGQMLLPNGFFAQQCENAIRRRFPQANAFRVYGQDGAWFFGGSL